MRITLGLVVLAAVLALGSTVALAVDMSQPTTTVTTTEACDPDTSILVDGVCAPCPEGTFPGFSPTGDRVCVSAPDQDCPAGQVRNEFGVCVAPPPEPPKCKPGYSPYRGKCYKNDSAVQPDGTELFGQQG